MKRTKKQLVMHTEAMNEEKEVLEQEMEEIKAETALKEQELEVLRQKYAELNEYENVTLHKKKL